MIAHVYPPFLFQKKNVLLFLAGNAKPTQLDYVICVYSPYYWSVQQPFDSHWLDECANSSPPAHLTIDQSYTAWD
jgi:hypothetical protein